MLYKFKEFGVVFSEAEKLGNATDAARQIFFQIFIMKPQDIAVFAVWIPRN